MLHFVLEFGIAPTVAHPLFSSRQFNEYLPAGCRHRFFQLSFLAFVMWLQLPQVWITATELKKDSRCEGSWKAREEKELWWSRFPWMGIFMNLKKKEKKNGSISACFVVQKKNSKSSLQSQSVGGELSALCPQSDFTFLSFVDFPPSNFPAQPQALLTLSWLPVTLASHLKAAA